MILRFRNAIHQISLCGPVRAAMLLGLRGDVSTCIDNSDTWSTAFHEWKPYNIGVAAQAAGITTGFFAKPPNGWGPSDPALQGWDAYWQIPGGNYTGYTAKHKPYGGVETSTTYSGNDTANYSTDVCFAKANAFVTAAPEPFLLYIWPICPHLGAQPATRHSAVSVGVSAPMACEGQSSIPTQPPWLQALTDGSGTNANNSVFTGARRSLLCEDEGIDALLDLLDTLTLPTVVWFMVDNGHHKDRYNRIPQGSGSLIVKNSNYPEVVKCDLRVRWPDGLMPGDPCNVVMIMDDDRYAGSRDVAGDWDSTTAPLWHARETAEGVRNITEVVSDLDIVATIHDLMGFEPTAAVGVLDGVSLRPLLWDVAAPWKDHAESMRRQGDNQMPLWWGINVADGNGWTDVYTRYDDPTEGVELYLGVTDPDCTTNVAAGNPAVVADYEAKLAVLQAQTEGQRLHASRPRWADGSTTRVMVGYQSDAGVIPVEVETRVA